MEAYLQNQNIRVIHIPYETTIEDLNRIRGMLQSEETPVRSPSNLSESESILFETMVNQIRSGNAISVYSSHSSLDEGQSTVPYSPVSPGPSEGPDHDVSSEPSRESNLRVERFRRTGLVITDDMARDFLSRGRFAGGTLESNSTQEEDSECSAVAGKQWNEDVPKSPQYVVIAHPQDVPAPLPSWTQVREAPSIHHRHKRQEWIKEVAMQKYWTERYPFFKQRLW